MTAKPLEFGVAYHIGMEAYYDPGTWDWDRQVVGEYAITKFVDKCEEQRKKALAAQEMQYLDEEVQADYDERVELGKGMLRDYFKNTAPREDIGWTPVKVEVGFMVPIPHPDTGEQLYCKCDQCWEKWTKHINRLRTQREDLLEAKSREASSDMAKWETGEVKVSLQPLEHLGQWDLLYERELWRGLPVVYAGRIDMLAVDNEGKYWIFDWKTAARISEDDEFLYLDDQIGSYVWALRKLGLNVQGFVYHEEKKGFPQPPKRNIQPRLGCWFSVNKMQDTDYRTFLQTVMTEDRTAYEEGRYDNFLEFLKNEGIIFYKRHQIHKSDYECQQMEYNIGQEALEMLELEGRIRVYPSPGRFGCRNCAFRQPCMEQNGGGDYQYMLDTLFERREHYYVRTEPSTESKGGE
jgi:hypothetical protein